MKGYLVYREEEAEKNREFIRMFYEEGKHCGISFEYIPYKGYQKKGLPDFVLNRTRDALVSRWYEGEGVMVLHSSCITEIGNHKMKTLQYLQENLSDRVLREKWRPDSILLTKERVSEWMGAAAVQDRRGFYEAHGFWEKDGVCILKSVDGHGGSEVAELFCPYGGTGKKGQEAWEKLYHALLLFQGKECILQEKIESDSRDVRVYILGGKLYQAIARKGKKDFRSNFSLGGTASCYKLSGQERSFVNQFLQAFQKEILGLAGLDFIIRKDGKLIFNELEEMVGTRMLYQNTDCNIVGDYVRWCYYSWLRRS